ncbi:MAG: tRNA (N(6)-L-threonylcarbamoyladenosine(37)-C(2))-methylthiotransferase MtaB [Anaerolineae bacterium]|jgi:threonylcarbamoyladenosine tRNA methylthiotransferase MtaB|nr:tRNA (N(6)-L-threonylcarbamoyladenosine(37)-C(2))-methylthiotransferase MtaB [Anaerolineae bacterium]
MKIHLRMLGCRLNQSEIDRMARQLEQQGHTLVNDAAQADEVIVNTCAVTADAVRSGRKLIRELHRQNDRAHISVTGCHAQLAPQEIAALPGVVRVVGNLEKDSLVAQITGQPVAEFDLEPHERQPYPGAGARTRAFIKVQDGCDNACTFCVTTIARGAGRSRPANAVVQEINSLHQAGYQEAVLTGVHLGSYGHDLGDPDGLRRLVQRLLAETAIPRLRLSSLEPWDLAPAFFDLWQNPRLCPHLHLPLQSGCDDTLRRMRRHTRQHAFRALVQAARAAIPDVRLTSDVIVGFPGETDEEFARSEAFIHEMDFAGLHVFRYSSRPGTPAAKMRGHLPEATRQARSQRLLAHAAAQEERFAARYAGRALPVLWEHISGASEHGFLQGGYTHHYLRVQAVHPRILTNHITPALLGAYNQGAVQATPVIE